MAGCCPDDKRCRLSVRLEYRENRNLGFNREGSVLTPDRIDESEGLGEYPISSKESPSKKCDTASCPEPQNVEQGMSKDEVTVR